MSSILTNYFNAHRSKADEQSYKFPHNKYNNNMDSSFFRTLRILDGGMGQELLRRGLKPTGDLWSASALLDEKYHSLVVDTHLDFIDAGAEVIVTTSFTTRRKRLQSNNLNNDYFLQANHTAGRLAQEARDKSGKKVLIAAGLPPQNITYKSEIGNPVEFKQNVFDQAKILAQYADFFYLDVMSSSEECQLNMGAIADSELPVLVGIHLRKNGKLPSGENLKEVVEKCRGDKWIGVILSCVSPEIVEAVLDSLQNIGIPFGFKINAFVDIPDDWKVNKNGESPSESLGSRKDLTPEKLSNIAKKFIDKGATIIGGCCETTPEHIKALAELRTK